MFIKPGISNGEHLKIIQVCELTPFFRDPQAAGQHGKREAAVCLERPPEHSADQADHFLIITVILRFVQRHVIFVDEEDRLLAVMFVQKPGQEQETASECLKEMLNADGQFYNSIQSFGPPFGLL